jgi:predicted Holliday junction resolvase-like endonuclease
MPFLKNYPYNPDNFRFIGSPIDGIQFEEDKIVLVEFKAANSGLSSHQKQIADTIDRKKVFFEEIRLS